MNTRFGLYRLKFEETRAPATVRAACAACGSARATQGRGGLHRRAPHRSQQHEPDAV